MTNENKDKGLYGRYVVTRANGNTIDPRAKYFVLRYDKNGSDPIHVKACQAALATYAEEIKHHLPKLSDDLIQELDWETP